MLEVMCSGTIPVLIRIVQISSPATACIGQPLLIFWSHTEQSWMFALIVAALKITYIVLHLYCTMINLKGIVAYVLRNVNVHLVNFFYDLLAHSC